jgi:hypothetical protein
MSAEDMKAEDMEEAAIARDRLSGGAISVNLRRLPPWRRGTNLLPSGFDVSV